MDDQHAGAPATAPRPATLERATRQCEVELLISGIAVFAMVQLAGAMDDAIFRMRPRFSPDWSSLLVLLYVYGKGAAVLLAGTFAVHLLLRARWIALAGMHAIRPQGIDWSRLRLGPISLAAEQRAMGSIADAVARADQRATTVFTIGVMVATIMLVLFVLVALFLGVPMALLARVGITFDPSKVLLLVMVAMLPFFVAHALDTSRGARLPPGSRLARVIGATYGFYRRFGMSSASNPAYALLTSHQGQRRTFLATMVIMIGVTLSVLAGYVAMRDDDAIGSYDLFPATTGATPAMDPAFYDDQRDPARDRPTPYLDRAVATGPYVRLVVPYEPDRDIAAMRSRCPHAVADQPAEAAAPARLACLATLRPVTLDGRPLAVEFLPASDPRTDRPALVALVDVRGLGRGRHVLGVDRPPRHDRDARPRDDDPHPGVRIPFWR